MKIFKWSLCFLLWICILSFSQHRAEANISDDVQIGGYFQVMPVYISADLPAPFPSDFWEYRFQNRLNLRWYPTNNISVTAEARTRLFAGDLVSDIPFYADMIDVDNGYFNLSWLIADEQDWFLHVIPDRLYAEWSDQDWSIRAGRQRVNWGINTMTNPNDLFNIYSFYDFDYPERPGTDAIRIQRFMGFASRFEVAYSPAKEAKQTVAAAMYQTNYSGYDMQFIGGYYRNHITAGGGWAGSISDTGFKGELMLFYDLDENSGEDVQVVAAVSAEHMFDNSLFLIGEVLYNKDGGRDAFMLLGEPLSANNPSFSRYQLTSQASYPVNPLLNISLAGVYYPDEHAVFVSPSVTFSVLSDLDLMVLAQLFSGPDDSVFANAGNVFAGSIKWNF